MSLKRHTTPPGVAWVRLFYLVLYSSYGATSIYRTLYYRRVGLSGAQIGALVAIQPLVALIAGPLWSLLADRLGIRSRLLTLITGLSIPPMLAMIWLQSFPALLALNILYALFFSPMQPLTDSIALASLGQDRHRYASIRAFGSLGYAPVAWLTGYLIQGRDIRWIFPAYALLMGTACLLSLRMRVQESAPKVQLRDGLGQLLKNRRWLFFMLAFFAAMAFQSVTFGYGSLYLEELGASESLIGFASAAGSVLQTLLMLTVLPRALQYWGSERLMLAALLVFALRFALWALFPLPWIAATSQMLLGLSYGIALIAAVDFADRYAPPGLHATSQSLATSLVNGLGRSLGGAIGGALYDTIGLIRTFTVFAAIAASTALTFGLGWRHRLPATGFRARDASAFDGE